jgi:hypothetical protein
LNKKLGVCVCRHAARRERPVNYIERFPDGGLSLSCGELDHSMDEDADDYSWVHIGHLLDADDTLEIAATLEPGDAVERGAPGESWRRA